MFTLGFSGCGSRGGTACSGSGCTPPPATPEILYGAPSSELLNQFINATIDPNTGGFSSVSVGTIPLFDTGGMVAVNVRFLYISTTFVNGLPNNGSEIFGYSINPTTGTLAPIAGSPFTLEADSPVQGLASAPNSYFLYAAVAGGIDAFTVNSATGVPTAIPGSPFASGNNPQLVVDPSGKFLYASDDDPPGGILAFTIGSSGALTPVQGSPFTIPGQTDANSVPFGIVDTGAFVYAALTATNQIAAFSIDSATGALASVPGSPFSDERNPAVLALADKFLYAVNEADGSISGYSISSSSGGLTQISGSPFASDSGELAADPSGRYLYDSTYEGILDFNINPDTGELTLGVASLSNDGSLLLTIVQLPSPSAQWATATNFKRF
jgi:6-phosphogluconolactonase